MMPNSRFDLTEIARSALNDLPEGQRAAFLAEMLTELRGPQALEHLSKARAAVNLRMQELIDEKMPLHELAAVHGEPAAVRARMAGCSATREYTLAVEDHPCYISDEEWAQYAAITGKAAETLALIKARHAAELAGVDPDFFPDDEHRVAYQRGLIDAFLRYERPRSSERKEPDPNPKAPLEPQANVGGART